MNFEVQYALQMLDSRTPTFFIDEALAKGDETAKRAAIAALGASLAEKQATSKLKAMLRLY